MIAEGGAFCYRTDMKVEINSRGNGACAICVRRPSCRIIEQINHIGEAFPDHETNMELVIYSCPYFKEKD